MHIGKCFCASSSTISALIPSPVLSLAPHSDPIPAIKPCDRLSRIGSSLVSSSIRGRAFAVIYGDSVSIAQHTDRNTTSRARSKRVWNSWNTMLDSSLLGTYAQPSSRKTLRFSTRSGTRVHLTCADQSVLGRMDLG
jgi:hypothetical protein